LRAKRGNLPFSFIITSNTARFVPDIVWTGMAICS